MSGTRIALVTGGSRGIGRAIALALADAGHDVAITYISRADAAAEVVAGIEAAGRRGLAIAADAADPAAAEAAFAAIEAAWPGFEALDVLVNNAGISRGRALMNVKPDDWEAHLATNLGGAYAFSRRAVVGMMKRRGGRIINVSSVAAFKGLPGTAAYAASKAGMLGLTKALAAEVGRYGVTVNALAPGFVETDMVADLPEAKKKALLAEIPLGAFGTPEDVAAAAVYLASAGARYVTGQVLVVDGGLSG